MQDAVPAQRAFLELSGISKHYGGVRALEGAHAAIVLGDAGQFEEGALGRDRILHGAGSGTSGLADARPRLRTGGSGHWVFFSLCAMISGAVKFTPQGRNWLGAKKLALRSGQ